MAKITFANKATLNENAGIADINKGRAADWNEVKNVINETLFVALGLDTDTWSSSSSYAIGDIVIDDNKLYENITGNNSARPSTDTTNWELVPIIVEE